MKVKEFIKIYDKVLPWEILSSFIKVMNEKKFNDAGLLGDSTRGEKPRVEKKVRNTKWLDFNQPNESLTNIHWGNFLRSAFKPYVNEYQQEFRFGLSQKKFLKAIVDVQCLKYEEGGHYIYHTDSAFDVPRCLSMILMLNNDYEGGELSFKWNDETFKIETKPNRLILWPSNFMYPHCVTPVTNGVRYSVVAWAL